MITIPPRNYCIIENPIIINKEGRVDMFNGQAKLAFTDLEYRFSQDPFPLYPGETLKQIL